MSHILVRLIFQILWYIISANTSDIRIFLFLNISISPKNSTWVGSGLNWGMESMDAEEVLQPWSDCDLLHLQSRCQRNKIIFQKRVLVLENSNELVSPPPWHFLWWCKGKVWLPPNSQSKTEKFPYFPTCLFPSDPFSSNQKTCNFLKVLIPSVIIWANVGDLFSIF